MNPPVWLWIVLTVGLVLNGLRLRAKIGELPLLKGSLEPDDSFVFLTGLGTDLGESTRRSAADLARRQKLNLLELIPADLPAATMLDLMRLVDFKLWRQELFAPGRSCGQALVAREEPAGRAGLKSASDLAPADLIACSIEFKPYAPQSADFAIAPGLRSGLSVRDRRAWLKANGVPVAAVIVGPALVYCWIGLAMFYSPGWGVAALIAWALQAGFVFAGTPLHPQGLVGLTLLRPLAEPVLWARTLAGRSVSDQDTSGADFEARREAYAAELAEGTDRFFEPPSERCPWCRGGEFRKILTVGDRIQRKPGRFTLVECLSCGHVFQNPRLSLAGLDFYYRDFYGGPDPTSKAVEWVWNVGNHIYRARAEMVREHANPTRWLDIGAGHGHFCLSARTVLPDTVFDGLDMADDIEEAARRGWVSTSYVGQFPATAPSIAGRYDVVSMHHYLEHTIDPFAELDAAHMVLKTGGHLLIEVPDPEWKLGRLLKGYWLSYIQPQHLHLAPIANLKQALVEHGFQPVDEHRGLAHMNFDFSVAALLLGGQLSPDISHPWSKHRPVLPLRMVRAAVWMICIPLALAGFLAERLVAAIVRSRQSGNVYRVLARKQAPA